MNKFKPMKREELKEKILEFGREATKSFVHGKDKARAGKALDEATTAILKLISEKLGKMEREANVCAEMYLISKKELNHKLSTLADVRDNLGCNGHTK